ncbi:MAG: protein kinase domain-containing protein [Marinilabiliaceae bacterium]
MEVIAGPAKGQKQIYDKPDCILCGRSPDAKISILGDPFISRYHFLIEIAPPNCKITDLDSKNGFFVGSLRYGGQKPPEPGMQQAPGGQKECYLQDGDIITAGETKIRIDIEHETWPADQAKLTDQAQSTLRIKEYSIERELAYSNLRRVYLARDEKEKRWVIIKRYTPGMKINKAQGLLFHKEVGRITKLVHENIVQLYKFGQIKSSYLLVYEYIKGHKLKDIIQKHPNGLDLNQAVPIMIGILKGLSCAHNSMQPTKSQPLASPKIIHRHLNPGTIFLTRKNKGWIPKISDFGLSQGVELSGLTNITMPDQLFGDPLYWPREQITHFNYLCPATDVYAAAAVFYEILTGHLPRENSSLFYEQCQRRSGGQPSIGDYMRFLQKHKTIPIRDRNPAIPLELAEIIDRALRETEAPLAKEQMFLVLGKLRYPDAGFFLKTLQKVILQLGISDNSSAQLPEGLEIEENNSDKVLKNKILHSMILDTSKKKALMIIDIIQSTEFLSEKGDTVFSNLVLTIHNIIRNDESAEKLIFLKCTGDGYLAVYQSITSALLALKKIETSRTLNVGIKVALHWGQIKAGPGGDPLGTEVHRVFRMESLSDADYVGDEAVRVKMPTSFRVVASGGAIEQMNDEDRKRFVPAGYFRLKGFKSPQRIWLGRVANAKKN